MSPLWMIALGFILFAIGMIIFNFRRLEKVKAFPYKRDKTPSANMSGFSYFIFLKFDKELTMWVILSWIGLILFVMGSLLNANII